MNKKVLLSQNGQALVKCEKFSPEGIQVSYEWWKDITKMESNTYREEKNGVTNIYCLSYNSSLCEEWLIRQFKMRVFPVTE